MSTSVEVSPKLPALLCDILLPTSAVTGYAIGERSPNIEVSRMLQALVYHILLPNTAITGYAIGDRSTTSFFQPLP